MRSLPIYRLFFLAVCLQFAVSAEGRLVKLASIIDIRSLGDDAQGLEELHILLPDTPPSSAGRYNQIGKNMVQYRYTSGTWKGGKAVIEYAKDLSFAEISIFDSSGALQRVYSVKGKTAATPSYASKKEAPSSPTGPVVAQLPVSMGVAEVPTGDVSRVRTEQRPPAPVVQAPAPEAAQPPRRRRRGTSHLDETSQNPVAVESSPSKTSSNGETTPLRDKVQSPESVSVVGEQIPSPSSRNTSVGEKPSSDEKALRGQEKNTPTPASEKRSRSKGKKEKASDTVLWPPVTSQPSAGAEGSTGGSNQAPPDEALAAAAKAMAEGKTKPPVAIHETPPAVSIPPVDIPSERKESSRKREQASEMRSVESAAPPPPAADAALLAATKAMAEGRTKPPPADVRAAEVPVPQDAALPDDLRKFLDSPVEKPAYKEEGSKKPEARKTKARTKKEEEDEAIERAMQKLNKQKYSVPSDVENYLNRPVEKGTVVELAPEKSENRELSEPVRRLISPDVNDPEKGVTKVHELEKLSGAMYGRHREYERRVFEKKNVQSTVQGYDYYVDEVDRKNEKRSVLYYKKSTDGKKDKLIATEKYSTLKFLSNYDIDFNQTPQPKVSIH